MSETISKLFIFAVGAAIGSAVTWKLVKTKYEKIAQEEIDSVKEVFSNRIKEKEEIKEYNDIVDDYISPDPHVPEKNDTEENTNEDNPYVIPPEEFGNTFEYDCVSLNYYTDGVLADDFGEVIEDVEGTVGRESLNRFGKYEPDSVFVRNDRLKTDYEILAETIRYSDVGD